ncbi:low molecular weight phosphatase family protein [Actinoplanes italicus]|uniref:Protein-tyrosine-phosphatase n=1 Tax=Actinoplanes italicus TaxID=113567 RepID=A0A2T0JLF6_9ACTN|nr:phosphatase [Actinoplanes italicus]PRX08445.1 protein-tyrosine-phosphatase [Actinoplanes italicus]GIE36671.1 low molecular weight phosphatase family protein [Actinoplanes italicus]
MNTDAPTRLAAATTRLAARFDGIHTPETVARYVTDSYVTLHRTAFADPRLPDLAEGFAADRLTALAPSETTPSVLFICIHNAGRSQMGAALMHHHADDAVRVHSAGSQPAQTVSKSAAAVLEERGLTLDDAYSKPITAEILAGVDVVVIAGGGEAVPRLPGPRYEVWDLPHPPGTDLDGLRAVRDEIDIRVQELISQLTTHH